MIFACPSVPHNGHHFLRNRVFVGYENNTPYESEEQLHSNTTISGHFHMWELHHWLEHVIKYRTVITMRHPARNLLSYQKRRKSYDMWIQQWTSMLHMDQYFNDPLFIHIDQPEVREIQVALIHDLADIDAEVDWSVDNDTGSRYGTHKADITEDLLEQVPQKFLDYYYNKMPQNMAQSVQLKEEGVILV